MNIEDFREVYCLQCYWNKTGCDILKVKLEGCCNCMVQDELDVNE